MNWKGEGFSYVYSFGKGIDLYKQAEGGKPQKDVKPVGEKRNRAMSFSPHVAHAENGIRAIKLDWLQINFDTDDFVLNAWLNPVFTPWMATEALTKNL